jgi:hypothetical protein
MKFGRQVMPLKETVELQTSEIDTIPAPICQPCLTLKQCWTECIVVEQWVLLLEPIVEQ